MDNSIESLVVCQTEVKDLSRMSIVLRGQDSVIEQARRQLEDLVRFCYISLQSMLMENEFRYLSGPS